MGVCGAPVPRVQAGDADHHQVGGAAGDPTRQSPAHLPHQGGRGGKGQRQKNQSRVFFELTILDPRVPGEAAALPIPADLQPHGDPAVRHQAALQYDHPHGHS